MRVTLPVFALALSAHAQVPTDAGALQQRIERERQTTLPSRVTPSITATQDVKTAASGQGIPVTAFGFRGNQQLSSEQLALVVAGYVNKTLDFAQLQAAAASVAAAYRDAGWVADAFLPTQDIRDGKVIIEVAEAVFGVVRIEGQAKRLRTQQLLDIVAAQQAQGKPAQLAMLDRAQLLSDDLPGVAVSGALATGLAPGQTDLVFKITDEAAFIGDVRADNSGSRSTGAARLAANLSVNSPAGTGDQISANAMTAEGSRYARFGYDLPVGSDGWRVGGNASHLGYTLVDAPGDGSSQSAGLQARYPVLRSRLANVFLSMNADRKQFDNRMNGATTTRYTTQAIGVTLSGNRFDEWAGGGSSSGSIGWTNGERHNVVGSTDGRYSKLNYFASRQQTLTADVSAYASWDGQISSDTLDTSESFYLGGANGVRAYPTNEGRGSSGDLAKLELRWRASDTLSSALFYDHGRVRNRDGSPSYSLKGLGLAVAWQTRSDVSLSAALARRIGDNPNAGLTGRDQGGSLNKNRLWLSGSWNY